MLINVTRFFRDPEAFAALGKSSPRHNGPQGAGCQHSNLGRRLLHGRRSLFPGDAAYRGHGEAKKTLRMQVFASDSMPKRLRLDAGQFIPTVSADVTEGGWAVFYKEGSSPTALRSKSGMRHFRHA